MGLFEGIENAESGSRVYISDTGNFVLEILKCSAGISKFKEERFFGVDFNVVESTNPKYPAGSRVSWYVGLRKDTPALSNVKDFAATAAGVPSKEVDAASIEMIVSDEQPLAGTKVKLATVLKKTKAGKDFTVHQWATAA